MGIKLTSMREVSNNSDLKVSTRNDELFHRKRASVFEKKEVATTRTHDDFKTGSTVQTLEKSPRVEQACDSPRTMLKASNQKLK
jgi:hypothetical protein